MEALGIGNRPLWLTETGMQEEGGGFGEHSPRADYLTDVFRRNVAQGQPVFNVIFWFALLDSPRPGRTFGLVDPGWSPRPSYRALQGLANNPSIH
jgi:hypothetical protein